MEKLKVLELIGGSLSDGGAETLVKDYLLNIDKERFETALFVDWVFSESATTRILNKYGQLIYTAYPRYSLLWRGFNRYFRTHFLIKGIKKTIRSFNPDVIHIHLAALHYLTFLKNEIKGRKLFYTCHSTVDAKLAAFPEEDKAASLLSKQYGMRFIALHDSMRKELNDRYNVNNSIVINNGIDLNRFRNVSETKEEIRQSLNLSPDSFVVGHVGRFVPVKNHDFILKVFELVHTKCPNSFLLLIGDGEQLEEFRTKLKETELDHFVNILSNRTDIPQLLKAMDVFLFPSIYEGLGIALIEAQASGLRCVASDTIDKTAFASNLVIPLNLSDPLEKWCDTLLDSKQRGPFNNRLDEFDIKSSVKQLEELYLEEE